MIAIMIIIIMIIKKIIIIRIKRMKTTNVNFKLFPSFLFICKKYFTKCSCLVCLTHLSDIKSNWRPDIQLAYPVQFLLSKLLFILNLAYQGDTPVSNTLISI